MIEPLTDRIVITALAKASGDRMSLGRRSSRTMSTMRAEACSTASHIRWLLARTGVLPGSAMPSASHAMCMVFAVPTPGHTPGPRMAFSLISVSSGSESWPLAWCPAARNTSSISQ